MANPLSQSQQSRPFAFIAMPDPIKVPKFRFEGQAAKLRKVVGHYPLDEDYKKMQRLAEVKAQEVSHCARPPPMRAVL